MNWPPVLSKDDFVRRYQKMEFGNCSPTWDTMDDLLAYGGNFPQGRRVPGLFHLRNREASGATYYNLGWSACISKWCEQSNWKGWYASQMVPTEVEQTLLIQGEVMQHPTEAGLYLLYSTVVKPMREALAEQRMEEKGLRAALLLQKFLNPVSWDWLNVLLDRYEQHVVEFSCYEKCWGTIPGYNTIYWEVRKY